MTNFAFALPLLVSRWHPCVEPSSLGSNRAFANSTLSTRRCDSHCVWLYAASSLSSSSSETPPSESHKPVKQTSSEAVPSTRTDSECPYCHNESIVTCPVCEGRGYLGRTITCYYCRGAKRIECPLCIDDIYKLSYVRPQNPTFIEDNDENDDNVSVDTESGRTNKK